MNLPMRRVLEQVWLVLACLLAATAVRAAGLVADPARPMLAIGNGPLAELLAQRTNQPVILNFWASWCSPCRDEMPSLQRLAQRHGKRGVTVLTIAVADRPDDSAKFLWDSGVTLPVLDDPDQSIARTLGVRTLPMTLVLDRSHRIVARVRGAIDWDDAATDKQIREFVR